jgi:hypothetical protein
MHKQINKRAVPKNSAGTAPGAPGTYFELAATPLSGGLAGLDAPVAEQNDGRFDREATAEDFACDWCGCPAIAPPQRLSDSDIVRCQHCKKILMTWKAYRLLDG